ncbi:MAG: nucleotidyl transferase AbiEii/AbiGii toxin family protein [Anaerolineae bacterium]
MITLAELRRASARLGLGLAQAEHEYVLLCALDGLSHTPVLRDTFALKGGTALRQVFFADWRHSVDLDFTVAAEFPAGSLREGLAQWFAGVAVLHGLPLSVHDLHMPNGAARVRARFVGPLGHPGRLLLDITLDELICLPWERRAVARALFAQPAPQVLSYSLDEILAEKLRAIVQRGKARDYYDVWRLLKEKQGELDLERVCQTLDAKCAHRGLGHASSCDLLGTERLAAAESYWRNDLSDQVGEGQLPDWARVVDELGPLLDRLLRSRRSPEG